MQKAMTMVELGPYVNSAGVESAIREAARRAFAIDPSLSVNERIKQEHFRRFLSRVFSEGERSDWMLKGGTGVLARVPSARATNDVDLFRSGYTLAEALEALKRLAKVDLKDHFQFEFVSYADIIGGSGQPNLEGYKVRFDVYVGAQKRGRLNVDLSTGAGVTAEVNYIEPANGLDLPRLTSYRYRVYPVVDQIADKVCATVMLYSGSPSTRERDLVDLVVFATTQDILGADLRIAIETEMGRRQLVPIDQFTIPEGWGVFYARMARDVPYCSAFRKITEARALVSAFIDPAIRGEVDEHVWRSEHQRWQTTPDVLRLEHVLHS